MKKHEQWKKPICLSLQDKPKRIRPPGDTLCRMEREFDHLLLRWKTPLRLGDFAVKMLAFPFFIAVGLVGLLGIFGLLPGTEFENGRLQWWEWVGHCLAGLVLAGLTLLFLYAFFYSLLEVGHATVWEFSKGTARFGSRYFGVNFLRNVSLADWASMEIRFLHDLREDDFEDMKKSGMLEELDWGLVFQDDKGNDIVTMSGLAKEEARWIADVLLREKTLIR